MTGILENIFKGFTQWIHSLCLEIVQYIANSLLDVFSMDLNYFRSVAPVTDDIISIMIAAGWALLLGNLVFQSLKSMVSGLGFEGEDPHLLFARTFIFGFLLLASQQICEIGLGISSAVIDMLQIPTSVTITMPDEANFHLGASWLLVSIVGFVIMWQIVRLFFEIAERYVVTAALVILSPLAFSMGGSRNTSDIFKGWCRMFGSMCLMMVMNVVFLKLLISAMGHMPIDIAVLPWTLLIVGIARVARKIDAIIARVGLNPAFTGDGLGRGLPGMVTYAVARGIGTSVAKAAGKSAGTAKGTSGNGGGRQKAPPGQGGGNKPPSPGFAAAADGGRRPGTSAKDPQGAAAASGGTKKEGAAPGSVSGAAAQTAEQKTASAQERRASGGGGAAKPRRTAFAGTRKTAVPEDMRGSQNAVSSASVRPFASGEAVDQRGGVISRTPGAAQGAGRQPPLSRAPSAAKASLDSTQTAGAVSRKIKKHKEIHTALSARADAKPIHQEGTPVISPPPGGRRRQEPAGMAPPGSGREKAPGKSIRSASGTAGTGGGPGMGKAAGMNGAASSGTAGTSRRSAVTERQSGVRQAPSGMAGLKPAGVGRGFDERSASSTGTAGTRKAAGAGHFPESGASAPPGTAGTTRLTGVERFPVGSASPPSGMAGMRRPPGAGRGFGSGETPMTGTAGTRKPSGTAAGVVNGAALPSGTAGTVKSSGTSRIRSDRIQHPGMGGAKRSKKFRRKGGPGHE